MEQTVQNKRMTIPKLITHFYHCCTTNISKTNFRFKRNNILAIVRTVTKIMSFTRKETASSPKSTGTGIRRKKKNMEKKEKTLLGHNPTL